MNQSPIFTRTYDLLLWLIPRTTKFPREQRFVLGKAVQETALRFQEALIEAALARPIAHNMPMPVTHDSIRQAIFAAHDLGLGIAREVGDEAYKRVQA